LRPAQDRFHIITEHANADFIYDPEYLEVHRTNELVIIQITLSAGRTLEVRKALYRRIAYLLNQEAGLRKRRRVRQSGRDGERELVFWQWRSAVRDRKKSCSAPSR
jgi:hypothetical protein